MSNLYKSAYVVQEKSDRVIDSNEMIAQKIQKLTEQMEEEMRKADSDSEFGDFVEGLDAVHVESLLEDPDAAVQSAPSIDEQLESAKDELNRLRSEAESIISEANASAGEIVSKAENDAAQITEQARKEGYNEGYDAGYSEGINKAKETEEQLLAKESFRQQEYDKQLSEMEPLLIEKLCDIYEHVLGIDLSGRSDVVMYLLGRALRTIDGGINFLIHVSSDDYVYASEHKEELTALLGSVNTLELIEDITLSQGQSFIETESGIYDCSFGEEMELLKKELKMLSREDA